MSGVVATISQFENPIAKSGEKMQAGLNQTDVQSTSNVVNLPAESITPDLASSLSSNLFGPLEELMADPTVEEIWVNSPSRVFVARNGVSELTTLFLSNESIKTLVERMLSTTGRRVDLSQPFVDAMLADGSRLHVVIPDITKEFWTLNIRKFIARVHSLSDLVANQSLSLQAANFLQSCLDNQLNIVVSGATGAGKTTFMNALLNSVSAADRIVTCEEVFEMQLTSPDWVALQTRQPSLEDTGEITLRRIIKEALRMRPSRLVIGEVRQAECLDLLVAMNSGMPSMCSIHANGAHEAISKLCLLPMLAGSNVSAEFVTPAVAASVDVVVHLDRKSNGQRAVREIAILSGRIEESAIEVTPVFVQTSGQLEPTDLFAMISAKLLQFGTFKSVNLSRPK